MPTRPSFRHALPIVLRAYGVRFLGPARMLSLRRSRATAPMRTASALAGFGGTFSRSVYGSCLNVEQKRRASSAGPVILDPGARARALRPHRQLWRVGLLLDPAELRGRGTGLARNRRYKSRQDGRLAPFSAARSAKTQSPRRTPKNRSCALPDFKINWMSLRARRAELTSADLLQHEQTAAL